MIVPTCANNTYTHLLTHSAATKALDNEPKQHGNPKKRKKARAAQQDTAISSLMDCYAAQRQQSRPGGWRVDLEPLPQRRMEPLPIGGEPPKVLNEAMCDVLGGGSLTKALSTAYKGVMSQVEYQKVRREGEREGERETEGGREGEREGGEREEGGRERKGVRERGEGGRGRM